MPSPSPSPAQSPNDSSFLGLPEFTRVSHERHRSGSRNLNRMNEISASILGRFSQEAPSTDLDSDHINVNTFPAQIRNLGSPNRTSSFLDLSLDMNLNSGTPISAQENSQISGVGSNMAADENHTGFSSDNSDLDDEYLETGTNHNVNEGDSSDENSADDDESDSNAASEFTFNNDYDFYRGVQHANRDGLPMDNGNNYYNSFISYTREHGYGSFSRMSLESIRATFPSSIHAPHRLLLSSARQNTTNQNTLVNMRSPPRDYESNRGFSLRRQNAIRVKPGKMSSQKLAIMANALYADFKGAFAAIRTENPYCGKLPIFDNHPCCVQPPTPHHMIEHPERRFLLKYKLSAFLQFRHDTRLWKAHADSLQVREKKKKGNPSVLKRKHPGSDVTVTKKQRLSRSVNTGPTPHEYVDLKLGERINVAELSPSERLNILDGLPCSYMKDGSAFTMKVVNTWAANSEADYVNVTFSQVNWSEKFLHGCFDVRKNLELSGDIYDITSFLGFLCGGSRSRYTINNANSVIQSKFSLLNDLFMTMIVDLGITNPKITQALSGTMQIPFSGEIIDFKRHDLRFLKDRSVKSSPRTRGISSRIENERARLQINEWLNVKPFSDFAETFFMNYLYFTEQKLKKISSVASSEQQANLEFAENMKESIFYISRNFQSVQNAKIPMIESKSRQINKELRQRRRHEPRSNLRKNKFMKDWESKICEKLSDHLTCGDTCLLNLQLNYMILTVRVDISAEIDKVFGRFLGLVLRDSERVSLEKKYKSLCKQILSSEAKDAVFVCSLNRKTGSLEMHNTRSHLDFKYSNTSQSVDMPLGSTGDSAGGLDDYFGDSLFSARASTFSEDPSLMATPTILRGESRRGAAGSFSHGGGSGQFDFI